VFAGFSGVACPTASSCTFALEFATTVTATFETFKLGKAKRNKRKGTAELVAEVGGPGTLTLSGKRVRRTTKPAAAAGQIRLLVKPKGKVKRKLEDSGRAKVRLEVGFEPTGAPTAELSRKLTLKQR
jgi:hypothetical protein